MASLSHLSSKLKIKSSSFKFMLIHFSSNITLNSLKTSSTMSFKFAGFFCSPIISDSSLEDFTRFCIKNSSLLSSYFIISRYSSFGSSSKRLMYKERLVMGVLVWCDISAIKSFVLLFSVFIFASFTWLAYKNLMSFDFILDNSFSSNSVISKFPSKALSI